MKPARITLIGYFATELQLGTNHAFAPDQPVQFRDSDLVVEVSTKQNEQAPRNGDRWQVVMGIRHQPATGVNFPYSYRVVLVGQFGVGENVKPGDEERFVRIQGASVLYGMAREIVRALTGRGPYRPVILPTVSFYEPNPVIEATVAQLAPSPAKKRSKRAKS